MKFTRLEEPDAWLTADGDVEVRLLRGAALNWHAQHIRAGWEVRAGTRKLLERRIKERLARTLTAEQMSTVEDLVDALLAAARELSPADPDYAEAHGVARALYALGVMPHQEMKDWFHARVQQTRAQRRA